MRKYETLFIINPELEEEATQAVVEKFTNLLKNEGAETVSVDEWGKKKLAYEIDKLNEGYYVLITFEAPSEVPEELQRVFKIDGNILRYIVVNLDEKAS